MTKAEATRIARGWNVIQYGTDAPTMARDVALPEYRAALPGGPADRWCVVIASLPPAKPKRKGAR